MHRLAALVLVSFLVAPRLGSGQENPPPSCETVTTVRCSGSAAPLALPNAEHAPFASPPVFVAPPPPAPLVPEALPPVPELEPTPPSPCCSAAPLENSAQPAPAHGGGWRLGTDENGQAMLERSRRVPSPGVWVPGLVVWLGSYLGSSMGGISNGREYAVIPFFGAFAASGAALYYNDGARAAGYAIGGVMQIGGFIMFIAGAAGGKKVERMPVQLSPYGLPGGGGMGAQLRF